ncbi:hypothetical protein D3C80_1115320 [compost metagenome]
MLGDFVGGQRLFDIGLHQQHGLGQLRMTGPQAVLQRNALALATFTNTLDHQLFRHGPGKLGPMVTCQHRQQQVQHRHATTSGQAVTIPVEQMAGGNHFGETLDEVILPAPVHGRSIAIKQAQLRQRVDPGRKPTHHATGTHQLLEGAAQRGVDGGRRLVGEQEQLLATFQTPGPGLARQAPGTFLRRLGLQEQQLVGHIRMHFLRDPQRLFGQRQRQGFGAGPDEKTDSLGCHGVQSETFCQRLEHRHALQREEAWSGHAGRVA